ncbi:hypothetical protein ANCDUO_07496 [Ancylostoma duodenale]|uniref:FYVE-type zinc finger domain-containing protein n=1 Tax=Ancylostoma duodenale TaxID=51022 RepID=A0A0C2GYL0_9BILA|nr:hypothetical protein ANCDUO_07496 [Ancylostoma duodenale]
MAIIQRVAVNYSSAVASIASDPSMSSRTMPEPPSGRACFHCQCRLGLIFNAGTRCAKCGRLLCNECRRGTPRSKWLCQICHAQRELKAASGEWVDAGDPAEISEVLLTQMRRAAMEKEKQEEQKSPTDPPRTPMISKRNLTLPTIATPSLLAVPSESEVKVFSPLLSTTAHTWVKEAPGVRTNFYSVA